MPSRTLPAKAIWGLVIGANICSHILLAGLYFLEPLFPDILEKVLQLTADWWWRIAVLAGIGIIIGSPNLRSVITRSAWSILIFGALAGLVWGMISRIVFYESHYTPNGWEVIVCLPSLLIKDFVPFHGSWYYSATATKFGNLSRLAGSLLGITLAIIFLVIRHIRWQLSQPPES